VEGRSSRVVRRRGRFVSPLSNGDLLRVVREALLQLSPADPTKLTQVLFDRSRAALGYPDAPTAKQFQRVFNGAGLTYASTLRTQKTSSAFGSRRARTTTTTKLRFQNAMHSSRSVSLGSDLDERRGTKRNFSSRSSKRPRMIMRAIGTEAFSMTSYRAPVKYCGSAADLTLCSLMPGTNCLRGRRMSGACQSSRRSARS
jgi:hypothetical protein